jgi:protein tyrosine phosphatase
MEASPPFSEEEVDTPEASPLSSTSETEMLYPLSNPNQTEWLEEQHGLRFEANFPAVSGRNFHPTEVDSSWPQRSVSGNLTHAHRSVFRNEQTDCQSGEVVLPAARTGHDLTPLPGRSFDGGSLQQTDFSNWYADEPNSSLMVHEELVDQSRTGQMLVSDFASGTAEVRSAHEPSPPPTSETNTHIARALAPAETTETGATDSEWIDLDETAETGRHPDTIDALEPNSSTPAESNWSSSHEAQPIEQEHPVRYVARPSRRTHNECNGSADAPTSCVGPMCHTAAAAAASEEPEMAAEERRHPVTLMERKQVEMRSLGCLRASTDPEQSRSTEFGSTICLRETTLERPTNAYLWDASDSGASQGDAVSSDERNPYGQRSRDLSPTRREETRQKTQMPLPEICFASQSWALTPIGNSRDAASAFHSLLEQTDKPRVLHMNMPYDDEQQIAMLSTYPKPVFGEESLPVTWHESNKTAGACTIENRMLLKEAALSVAIPTIALQEEAFTEPSSFRRSSSTTEKKCFEDSRPHALLFSEASVLPVGVETQGIRAPQCSTASDALMVVSSFPEAETVQRLANTTLQRYQADSLGGQQLPDTDQPPALIRISSTGPNTTADENEVDTIDRIDEIRVDDPANLRIPELSTDTDRMVVKAPVTTFNATFEQWPFNERDRDQTRCESGPISVASSEMSVGLSSLNIHRQGAHEECLFQLQSGRFRDGCHSQPETDSDLENQSGPRSFKWSRTERSLSVPESPFPETDLEPQVKDWSAPSTISAKKTTSRSLSLSETSTSTKAMGPVVSGKISESWPEHRRDRKRVQRDQKSLWKRTASVVVRSLGHTKRSMQPTGRRALSTDDGCESDPSQADSSATVKDQDAGSTTKASMAQSTAVHVGLSLDQSQFDGWILELEQTIARLASPASMALHANADPRNKGGMHLARRLGMRMFDHFRHHHFGPGRRRHDPKRHHETPQAATTPSGGSPSTASSSLGAHGPEATTSVAGMPADANDPFPGPDHIDGFTVAFRALDRRLEREGLAAGATFEAAQQPLNRHKNRYLDVLPFDRTRVRLLEVQQTAGKTAWLPDTDYINASWIRGVIPESRRSAYIAAQGPLSLPGNERDFWHMIAEQRVPCVVMLARTIEHGREKSAPYMRDGVFGAYQVRLIHQLHWQADEVETSASLISGCLREAKAKAAASAGQGSIPAITAAETTTPIILRIIELERVQPLALEMDSSRAQTAVLPPMQRVGDRWRLVHIQYSAWPDHGVPSTVVPLIQIVDLVNEARVRYGAMQACFTEQELTESTKICTKMESSSKRSHSSGPGSEVAPYRTDTLSMASRSSSRGRYGPVVVHCSAGIGRTGTWIALHLMLEKMRQGLVPANTNALSDQVVQTVLQLRAQRLGMVQTPAQYRLLHEALLVSLQRWKERIPPLQLDWDALTEPSM